MSDLHLLRGLRQQFAAPARHGIVPLGVAAVDAALPWGGLARGALHELAGPPGDGAVYGFAAALLARCAGAAGQVLWCRRRGERQETGLPYGPGLARYGLDTGRLILVEAGDRPGLFWAMEEGLRAQGIAAVLGEGAPDLVASRRLQLAAEAGGATMIVLGEAAMGASAARTRWSVASAPYGVCAVELRRCRGGGSGRWLMVWDDAALRFDLAAALADRSLAPRRAAG